MSKLCRWSLVTLLFVIITNCRVFSFPREMQNELNCPSVTHCECSISTHYEIACPNRINANITLRVEPQRSTNRVEIECNSDDTEIFNHLPEWNIGESEVVKFNGCPTTRSTPANTSVHSVFQRLGIRNVHTLIFFARSPSKTSIKVHTLPERLFANIGNVTSLYLRSDKMRLPSNIFQSLHNLEYLQISSTDLSNSIDGIFRDLSKLKRLQLWNNNLRNVSKEMFAGISSVIDLEISSNDIDELSSDVFTYLTALESIDLNGNRINTYPRQIFNKNKALKKIRMSGNHLKSNALPAQLFGRLPQLTAVWINNCNLTSLPDDLFIESTNLRNISLAYNNLTSIPKTILWHQSHLLDLDMSFNQLLELDDNLFDETIRLTVLRLSHNRLSNISSNLLSELKALQELYLDNNDLHTVHMAAFDGTSIRVLHLQNNYLEFENIDETVLWDVERASPFQMLKQLQVLNMRNNSMRTFLNDWHISNVALKNLDVSYNEIKMIHFRNIFNNWNDSIVINLSNNQISTMSADKDFMPNRTQSQVVWILNHNPLNCDCLVVHFLNSLRNQEHRTHNSRTKFITNQLECASPLRFANQRPETVPLVELTCPLDKKNANKKRCPDKCLCFVRTFDSTAVFNCSNANLTKVPTLPSIKSLGLQFYELHIENNNISTLATTNSTGYDHVYRIFAKNNSIVNISSEYLPNNLFELDLSANKLKRLAPDVLYKLQHMPSLRNVSFGQNPWICDCATYELMNFIKNHVGKIVGINEITCENDKSISLIDASSNLCPITTTAIVVTAFLTISVLFAIIFLLSTLYYKNYEEILVWLFAHNQFKWLFHDTSKNDDHKKYDALILYSTFDEKFVAENLMPQLENGPKPLKICLLVREMHGGDYIPEQMAKCVDQSRRTIIVLTPNLIEYFKKFQQKQPKAAFSDLDIWAFGGFRLAHGNAMTEQIPRVIIIKKGDLGCTKDCISDLKPYLKSNIYLQWDEKPKQPEKKMKIEQRFFNKLRLAIAHPDYFKTKENHKKVENVEEV